MKKNKRNGIIIGMLAVGVLFSKNIFAVESRLLPLNKEEIRKEEVKKQKIMKEECYKQGEAIIMYEKENPAVALKLATNAILNNYSVVGTLDFENIKIKDNVVKTYTVASKNEDSITLSMSLVKSDKYNTEELIKILKKNDWVVSVEPNYIIKANSITNDTYADYQWGLENNGQNAGTEGFDINPIVTTSENEKVIAIIDSGVDYTHPDLANVMWHNPYSEEELPGIYGL